MIDLLRYLNIIIYEKIWGVFPTKNDYKSESKTSKNPHGILVFKIKTEKIFVTLNLLPTIF